MGTVAIAYLRVSTDTDRQALGVEAQRAAVLAWCAREGASVAAWYTEEVSGGAPLHERPGLLEALAAVGAHGAKVLVVQRLDRFTRDVMSGALAETELARHGASLVCTEGGGSGDDPTAQLVRGVLTAVARFERHMIGARTRAALAAKRARGERLGPIPFGQMAGEETALSTLRELRASGLSLRKVSARAAELGIVTRRGEPFTAQSLANLLTDDRSGAAALDMSTPRKCAES